MIELMVPSIELTATAVYTRVLNLVSSMYTAALIKSASRFTQCMAPARCARVFVNFYNKFSTIEKNLTVSDREFDYLANTMEFFGLRIFSLGELLLANFC